MNNQKQAAGMMLLNEQVLEVFKQRYCDAADWINKWVSDVESSLWKTSQDIKNKYSSASFLAQNTVIFNVKGNRYRLEVKVAYQTAIVKVIWAGTHQEYDKRNAQR